MKCCDCHCPEPAPKPVLPGCLGLYQQNGFDLTYGESLDPKPEVDGKLAVNDPFLEQAYGTCIKRVTDHAVQEPQGFARHYYSRKQVFNADDTLMHIVALDGFTHLYNAVTFEWIKRLPSTIPMESEFNWDDNNPNIFYHLGRDGEGGGIHRYEVDTDTDTVIADFTFRWPFPQSFRAWTRGEGSPSRDQRYWCLQVEDRDYNFLGIMIFDLVTNTIIASKDGAALGNSSRPDHCSMSISGDWCVVSWLDEVVRFDKNLNQREVIADKSEHSDLALLTNNHDVYVSIDYQSNNGDIYMVNLHTLQETVFFASYIDGTARAFHFSGRGYDKKGWVIFSTYANGGNDKWLDKKIMALNLEDGTIVNLAFHQSIFNGYWTEPQATVSRDFQRIVFSSNWDVNHQTDIDTYEIILPSAVLLNIRERAEKVFRSQRPTVT